ncbi:hypothetical protein CsatB_029889 [Cannabis sativa]|uniref:uncharacterized protein LOC115719765 n=1 Tax=Cannabis sativa TaxID=3483 RepID=UPI0011E01EE2|nr:uncharacterized protein LOC115719765 [Cannabis sativa]
MEAEAKADNKSPTRLKAHAPPCLLLDQIISMAAVAAEPRFPANYPEIDSCKAIPLLSPLILSPNPDAAANDDNDQERIVDEKDTSVGGNDDDGDEIEGDDDKDGDQGENGVVAEDDAVSPKNGWQHPAVPTFVDPSSLFSFFQSQCIIANQAQS